MISLANFLGHAIQRDTERLVVVCLFILLFLFYCINQFWGGTSNRVISLANFLGHAIQRDTERFVVVCLFILLL